MTMPRTTIDLSRHCASGLHGFCKETRATCGCTGCHLGPCSGCGDDNLQKTYEDGDDILCAGCYRLRCQSRPAPETRCDKCGKGPAFRNPGTRKNEYLCRGCHVDLGEPVKLTSSVAGFALPCKGQPTDDPRHEWVHVRGTRFRCLCTAELYSSARRDEVSRQYRDSALGT